MKIEKPNFDDDVVETRRTPSLVHFSVEVIIPSSGWAEIIPEELDIFSALHLVDQLRREGAKLHCRCTRAMEHQ